MKKKKYKILCRRGDATIKVGFDDRIVARCEHPAQGIKMKMIETETNKPLSINFKKEVLWMLAEGIDNTGKIFQYVIGLPIQQEVNAIDRS